MLLKDELSINELINSEYDNCADIYLSSNENNKLYVFAQFDENDQ